MAKKIGSFSLIERVILSAGAMLIFSVSFPVTHVSGGLDGIGGEKAYKLTKCSEEQSHGSKQAYTPHHSRQPPLLNARLFVASLRLRHGVHCLFDDKIAKSQLYASK